MKEKFINYWKKLFNDLKPMTWRQRLDHLWTYYKVHAIVFVFAVVIAVSWIYNAMNPTQTLMNGVFANVPMTQEGMTYLSEGYLEKCEAAGGKLEAPIFEVNFNGPDEFEDPLQNQYALMGVASRIAAQELDYLMMDEISLEIMISQNVFADLRNILTEEELAQWEGKIIYVEDADTGSRYPVALDITELPIIHGTVGGTKQVFYAVVGNAPNMDDMDDFWAHILAWEPSVQTGSEG